MENAIVGREAELSAVERFLDNVPTGPVALVIEGEAGIGKTTVFVEGLRAAEARRFRVLQARPAESEAKLSYAALADLVGRGFDDTRGALPAVQERALAAALFARRGGRSAESPHDGNGARRRRRGDRRRRACPPGDRRRAVARPGLGGGAVLRRSSPTGWCRAAPHAPRGVRGRGVAARARACAAGGSPRPHRSRPALAGGSASPHRERSRIGAPASVA